MARIGSYPIDAVIQDKDAWIGTENTNRVTRQFTAKGIAEYIDTKNVGLVFVGATNLLPGKKGLVPAPLAGQEGMYLKGDLGGGWTTIPVYTLDVPAGTTNVNLINTDGAGAIINSFITLTGGTYLTSVHTSGSQITFNHDNTTRSDTTSAVSPAAGASVPLVASVTSNATGHITAIDVKTVTWPADSDTTYTIDVPNATTSINLAGSDGTNDPIAFTTVAGNNGMTISRTDANTLNFNSKWQINNVNQDGYVPKGTANANKFWATDANGNPGWTFQPSQDQTLTSTGTSNASTGVVLSQNGGTVIIKGDGSTISASSNNTTNTITLAAINRVNTTYTLPVAAGAANTAVINLTDNSAVVSSVTFNGTANKIAISETVGNNGDITIGMPDDVTVTGELTVSGTGQSSFGGQVTIPQTPTADTDAASKKYVDDLVSGGLTFRGTFNAATGEILSGVSSGSKLYNCPGGAGTRIAVAVGDYYIVATAGGSFYCSGATLDIGDSIIATAAANADASVVTGWSVVQSDEGVASFTNANGTFVSAGTVNSNATGAVTMGTIDLSATGTKNNTTFLRGDNTWAVPAYVSYSAMTTSTLGLGKIKYDFGSTPAAESQSTTASRTYGVTKNASDQLVVNVPWLNSSDVNSVTASGATTALSGLSSTPNTGSVVIGLDIHGRGSLGSPAADDELMIYDTSTAKNVKVLVSDLASYAGSAATNQVTYWTSANEIGGAAGFTFAGGANGAVTMGGALTVSGNVGIGLTADSDAALKIKANGNTYSTGNIILEDADSTTKSAITHVNGGLYLSHNATADDLSITSGNATFAGKIICNNVGNDRKIEFNRTGANVYSIEHDSAFLYFYNVTTNSIPLKLANNNNATFASNVTANGIYTAGNSAIIYKAQRTGGAVAGDWSYDDATTDMSLGTSTAHSFSLKTGNTRALTINSSQNATFAGNVGIGITPSPSSTVVDVLQLGKGMTIMGNVNDDRATMGANLYLDAGTAFRYVMDGYAGRFSIEDGQMIWGVSATGTAGNVATVDTKMTLKNNGNLGIGTGDPDYRLHLLKSSGDTEMYINGQNGQSSLRMGLDARNWQIKTAAAPYLWSLNYVGTDFQTSNIITAETTGNVGIGTDSLDNKLDVFGTSGNTNIRIYDSSANSEVGLKLQGDAATWTLQNWGSGGDKLRVLNNAGTSVQTWQENGSVGIGTVDPDLTGFGWKVLTVMGGTGAGEAGVLELAAASTDANGQNLGIISFNNGSTRNAQIASNRDTAADDGRLSFWTSPGSAGVAERLRIKSDGNILVADTRQIQFNNTDQFIGATSVNDLEIKAGDDINYRSNFSRFFSGTTEHARLTGIGATSWVSNGSSTHKFGVGTSGPTSKLTVYGGGATSSTLELRGAANGGDNATVSTQQSMVFQIGSAGATGRSFTFAKNGLGYSDGTALFAIDSNGGTFNRSWAQTGTTSGTSIVQTTLIPEPGVYEFYLKGNPNAGGSSAYRSIQAGLITIACDYTVANSVFLRIEKVVLAEQGGGSSNIQLNLNVYMYYDGNASDTQSFANKDSSVIYLTVSNYAGTIGSGQEVRLTRKI